MQDGVQLLRRRTFDACRVSLKLRAGQTPMLSKNSNRRSLFSVLLLVPSYDLCFSYLCKGSRASISSSISSEWMSCAFWPFLRFFLFFSSLYFMEKHLGKCCRKKYYVKKRVVTQQSFEGARTLGHIKTYKR